MCEPLRGQSKSFKKLLTRCELCCMLFEEEILPKYVFGKCTGFVSHRSGQVSTSCCFLGRSWGHPRPVLRCLGRSWCGLGSCPRLWKRFWLALGTSLGLLAGFWEASGWSWIALGAGTVQGGLGVVLDHPRGLWKRCWLALGTTWRLLWGFWRASWRSWVTLGAVLAGLASFRAVLGHPGGLRKLF